MTNSSLKDALQLWNLSGSSPDLLAERENRVYAVSHGDQKYALRLHRPGYRSLNELRSELAWMKYLSQQGLHVPTPIATADGQLIPKVGDSHASLLTWLDGVPIGKGTSITSGQPVEVARKVGAQMARLHMITDQWRRPADFERPKWTAEEIVGETPLWGRFWEHPDLRPDEIAILQAVRQAAQDDCAILEQDVGLIHADLLTENLVMHEGQIGILDFDDCVIGYHAFELATFLLRYLEQPDFNEIRAALLEGYSARAQISQQALGLALLLRALTYVGWIVPRLNEPGNKTRSTRMIARALGLAQNYLEGRQ